MKQASFNFSDKIPAGGLGSTNDSKHCEVRYENYHSQIRKQDNPRQTTPPEKYFKPNTDNGIVFKYLLDGLWHNAIEAFEELKPGKINWAFRTRVSNIKLTCEKYHLPYKIESRKSSVNKCNDYRMIYEIH